MDTGKFRINPGQIVQLKDMDPDDTAEYDGDKGEASDRLANLTAQLQSLQEQFYAAHQHALLIVLQGMDTSGKDGTIAHVFDGVNPQGVRVTSFKAPTFEELSHDFLWRIHQHTPEKGMIAIFNRSHYEDVLIVRVHNLVPEAVWEKRYNHINEFEHMLSDEGTVILKFYLHINKKEQRERLLERLDTPGKQWKFNPEDLKERDYWKDYTEVYEAALSRTSTEWAPWYVVPANKKWFRNLLVASVLVETLQKLHPKPPEPIAGIEKYRKEILR